MVRWKRILEELLTTGTDVVDLEVVEHNDKDTFLDGVDGVTVDAWCEVFATDVCPIVSKKNYL